MAAAEAVAHTYQDDSPCRKDALGHAEERRSCWRAEGIATTPGDSVEAAGIATAAVDSKRGRARGEEDRKPVGTEEDISQISRCDNDGSMFTYRVGVRRRRLILRLTLPLRWIWSLTIGVWISPTIGIS